jgi:hypothetical protein
MSRLFVPSRYDHDAVFAASLLPMAPGAVVLLLGAVFGCSHVRDDQPRVATQAPTPHTERQTTAGLQGDRTITGTVTEITSNEIKVNTGEVQPRFLPLNLARQKGMTVRKGDQLRITLNEQNLIVDYHRLGKEGLHRIITGELATPLTIGQERAMIRTDQGAEEGFEVESQARSKLAAIPVGVRAVFLIDEANKIADATFGSREAVEQAKAEWQKKSPIKGAHQQVYGTMVRPLKENQITIRTEDGQEQPFGVREIAQGKLSKVRQGEPVILMVDDENQVVDVALSPQPRG